MPWVRCGSLAAFFADGPIRPPRPVSEGTAADLASAHTPAFGHRAGKLLTVDKLLGSRANALGEDRRHGALQRHGTAVGRVHPRVTPDLSSGAFPPEGARPQWNR